MKKLLIVISWFATSLTTLLTSIWAYNTISSVRLAPALIKQEASVLGTNIAENQPWLAYAAIPEVVTELRTAVQTKDARPVIIRNYFTNFDSPMLGSEDFIVSKAEELGSKLEIDATYLAFLTVAIAQNESNLGKKMPPNCHNAWGYGIHSAGTLCFENWEQGIDKFMTGVAENFMALRGLESPEEIMTRYTPHSPDGAWAKGVNQFLDDLYTGEL